MWRAVMSLEKMLIGMNKKSCLGTIHNFVTVERFAMPSRPVVLFPVGIQEDSHSFF